MSGLDKEKEEFQHDWYGILGCDVGSPIEDIARAARKLALKYHPDKTTEADASAKFLLIQKAKEILTDETKKKLIDDHYESVKKREQYEAERSKGMDERRKRFRDALERNVENEIKRAKDPNEVLAYEVRKNSKIIDKIRKQNQSMMEQAMEEMRRNLEQKNADYNSYSQTLAEEYGLKETQLKLKWKKSITHDDESLKQLLSPYGGIEDINKSATKGSSAIITFSSARGARAAMDAFAGSEDYRISFAHVDKKEKASAYAHDFTSSSSLNTELHREILRAKEIQEGNKSLEQSYLGDCREEDYLELKRIRKQDFEEYQKEVLDLLRSVNSKSAPNIPS